MLIILRVLDILISSTLAISLTSLRKILIIDYISEEIRCTTRLWSLLRNFVCATNIAWYLIRLLHIGTLFKRLWVDTVTLLTQSGGNLLIVRYSLKMSLYFPSLPVWQFKSHSTSMWLNNILDSTTVVNTLNME